jgi:hypothetical protein
VQCLSIPFRGQPSELPKPLRRPPSDLSCSRCEERRFPKEFSVNVRSVDIHVLAQSVRG